MEMPGQWENIIGQERMKKISGRFYDNTIKMNFPDLDKNDYNNRKLSILSELESTGNILIEFEKSGFLTHDEVSKMIEITAMDLICRNAPSAMFNDISLMLDEEKKGEDEWFDRELKYIERILDSLKHQKRSYE